MRDFKGMKRQRGRNRTGGGGPPINVKPGQNANRAFDSNGPDNVKVRGHAQHVYEKYQQLARDAAAAGDPVLAENYLQHGEHYFRTLRVLQPNRPVTDIINRDSFASGFDLDFEDAAVESAMEQADAGAAAVEAQAPPAEVETETRPDRFRERSSFERSSFDRQDRERQDRERQGGDRPYAERQNGERSSYDRQNQDRSVQERQGQERQTNERQNSERSNAERQNNDRPNNDRFNNDRHQGERSRFDGRQDRFRDGREERAAPDVATGDARRQPRPDRERPERERFERNDAAPGGDTAVTSTPEPEASPVLRSLDGGVSQAPAFLSAAPAPSADEPERRPRRRTRRPTADDAAPTAIPESEDA